MPEIQCKHCPHSTWSSPDVARNDGWRMFKGLSVTGKELDDVACPTCSGYIEGHPPPSWRVRCNTCDWEWEDEYDEGPLTAKQARQVADDHECEPWLEIQAPGDSRWLPPSAVNKDGSLRDSPASIPGGAPSASS